MRKIIITGLFLFIFLNFQAQDSTAGKSWEFNAELDGYIFKDDFFLLPIATADHNRLHLETRYNYEDMQTVSIFGGYLFSFGKKLHFDITPMFGGSLGNTYSLIPALELEITLGKFGLYSEQEYVFDLAGKEGNFYYNWSELTYSPTDWFYFGLSGQRTRLYKTDLDIQRGLMAGFTVKSFSFGGYLFNIGFDDPFGVVFVSYSF